MRVATLDIESAPHMAYVWGFYQQNIPASQVIKNRAILSYAYKWLGEDRVYYEESRGRNDKRIVSNVIKVLDEADVVIAHNAKKFDLGVINARAIAHGIKPPSPYKMIDTLLIARDKFKFDMNNLEFLAKYLGCTPKGKHKKFPGFELWIQLWANNPEAWEELREYNIQDVLTLEEVYLKMRPWIDKHPNAGLYNIGEEPVCPKCGSKHIHYRGYTHTGVSRFRRFQCQDCGGWGRLRSNVLTTGQRQGLATNAS